MNPFDQEKKSECPAQSQKYFLFVVVFTSEQSNNLSFLQSQCATLGLPVFVLKTKTNQIKVNEQKKDFYEFLNNHGWLFAKQECFLLLLRHPDVFLNFTQKNALLDYWKQRKSVEEMTISDNVDSIILVTPSKQIAFGPFLGYQKHDLSFLFENETTQSNKPLDLNAFSWKKIQQSNTYHQAANSFGSSLVYRSFIAQLGFPKKLFFSEGKWKWLVRESRWSLEKGYEKVKTWLRIQSKASIAICEKNNKNQNNTEPKETNPSNGMHQQSLIYEYTGARKFEDNDYINQIPFVKSSKKQISYNSSDETFVFFAAFVTSCLLLLLFVLLFAVYCAKWRKHKQKHK